jgi:peptidoglycan-N-acetylglucosamine deacetylase
MDLAVSVAVGLSLLGSLVLAVPGLVVEWASRTSPEVVFQVETSEPLVALTIDDGPSEATAEILEVLEEHGARATFFLIGERVRGQPEMARRIVDAGHDVAHHMMEDRPSREMSPEEFEARFDEMDAILRELGGSRLFRPGSGWYDEEMIRAVEERGYRTVLGSVYPFDAHMSWTGFLQWYVLQNATPGSVVVLHEGEGRGFRTAEVLRTVLPELNRRGYRVVTASQLLEREDGGGDVASGERRTDPPGTSR